MVVTANLGPPRRHVNAGLEMAGQTAVLNRPSRWCDYCCPHGRAAVQARAGEVGFTWFAGRCRTTAAYLAQDLGRTCVSVGMGTTLSASRFGFGPRCSSPMEMSFERVWASAAPRARHRSAPMGTGDPRTTIEITSLPSSVFGASGGVDASASRRHRGPLRGLEQERRRSTSHHIGAVGEGR